MAEKYLTENPSLTIDETIKALNPDQVLIVTDFNVRDKVLPGLTESSILKEFPCIAIPVGEEGKGLETVVSIWNKLEEIGATRRTIVLNIGGGVVTDLGGFAASAFKRGIRTVNFPTTLLGAVDAATGGKTGINFNGLKNEIGAFHMPERVIVSAFPFRSLPKEEILSGYAEMIKTALISDKGFYFKLLDFDRITGNSSELGLAVEKCVQIKDAVVEQDPQEKGLRKILNFGHTGGHAFESIRFELGNSVSHGKAVAHGMLLSLILSHLKLGFDSNELNHYRNFLKTYYGGALISCDYIDKAITKMSSDKKNEKFGEIAFTLLKEIGEPEINCKLSSEDVKKGLEIYIDLAS